MDGAEQTLRATTDAQGNFSLSPCPAGSFFVHIDGRTSPQSSYPNGSYYPFVGKRWEADAGKTDNLCGSSQDTVRGTVYLPKIVSGTMTATSQVQDTKVVFPASVLAANPLLAGTEINVPANSLFADGGVRGGRVGIAPVAPDRLPSPLPPGLNLPLVITIQTDGASNFDRPVPLSFPNLPDPITGQKLAPGAKSALWSFNHDIGDWEIVGPMTVTEDGLFVKTDAGVGVLQPGWHGTQPGSQNEANPPEEPPCESYRAAYAKTVSSAVKLGHDTFLAANSLIDLGLSIVNKNNLFVKFVSGWNLSYNAVQCFTENEHKLKGPCGQLAVGVIGLLADIAQLNPVWAPVARSISIAAGFVGARLDKDGLQDTKDELLENAAAFKAGLDNCVSKGDVSPAAANQMKNSIDNVVRIAPPSPQELDDIGKAGTAITQIKAGLDQFAENKDNVNSLIVNSTPENPSGGLTSSQIERIMADVETVAGAQRDLAGLQDLPDRLISRYNQWEGVIGTLGPPPVTRPRPGGSGTGGVVVAIVPPPVTMFYMLVNGAYEDRFKLSTDRRLSRVLQPTTSYKIWVYDPSRNMICSADFFSASNGSSRPIPPVVLLKDTGSDSDNDGLSAEAERIIGTNPTVADTDNDGIKDGTEVKQGTNPLDGLIVSTGVIASAPTSGHAVDVSALNNIAATANGASGITLFNVLSGLNPVRLQEIDTPGTAVAVAIQGERIGVADYSAGLAIVDISSPANAAIVQQVNLGSPATCVTTYGPIACVGTANGTVTGVDLRTGAILWRVISNAGEVADLAVADQTLYAYRVGRVDAISLNSAVPAVTGSVVVTNSGSGRQRLSVGPGVLYAANLSGWDVLDIATNPLNPVVVAQRTTGQRGFKQLVSTGSSLAVAAAGVNSGAADIDLYDAGANGRGNSFLTTLTTPGFAEAVSIYNGLAYVADGDSGLQVVNYRAYDNLGVPPAITLTSNFNLAGGTAEEGALMRLTAQVGDDVQVRNVEFYVDGALIVTDGNFPFEHRFVTPAIAPGKTSFTIRARATDTGGNATWTDELTLTLVPDATPPQVTAFFPPNNMLTGAISELSVTFSEPMDVASLSAGGLTLMSAGTDGVHGNADDVSVSGVSISFVPEVKTAYVSLSSPLSPGRYRLKAAAPAADAAGNAMASPATSSFKVFSYTDTDGDGVPDDWEIELGLNPNKADSNNNGIPDGMEDFDNDGLRNA